MQAPQDPPQPSSPHLALPQLGTQSFMHKDNWLSQWVPLPQVPQEPPQPSPPQTLPLQLGAHSQVPDVLQYWIAWQLPQEPPQLSSPQTFLLPLALMQVGWHGQSPQSCGQLVQVSPLPG